MARRLIVAALLGALVGLAVLAAGPARPSPGDPALLHPIERVAYSEDWRFRTTRRARIGDWVFVILRLPEDRCASIMASSESVTYRQMLRVDLTVPSGEGGEIGAFHEILAPRNAETCGRSRYVLAEWRVDAAETVRFSLGETALAVEVELETAPRTGRPFFVGMGNANLIDGHCPDAYCAREGEFGQAYAELLVAHGIQPIQAWARVPPIRDGILDLDEGEEAGRSFRQLVMAPAISGRVGFPRLRRYPDPRTYLKALEKTVHQEGLVGRAWVYAVDEPHDRAALAEELRLYRRHAPSVRVMVTTNRHAELDPLIDVYAPVLNRLYGDRGPDPEDYAGKELWTYASCMGSCGPNRAGKPDAPKLPGPDTGLPDFLIDRPAARLFAFFKAAARHDLDAGLYYEATEGYRLIPMGIDVAKDPWNFGGNGDGLLVFPGTPGRYGLDRHEPIPSFRLTLIRHALQTYW